MWSPTLLRPFGIDAAGAATALAAAGSAKDVAGVLDPTGNGEPWVAPTALCQAESDIADGIRRLTANAKALAGDRAVRAAAGDLDEVQTGAVAHAAAHGVSLLTGGPGTGKSRTVSAIVALCRKVEVSVALAAPTGRAAKRLEELAGHPATTVHRLLGARRAGAAEDNGSIFDHDAFNPLEVGLVVVDEASMLDVELAAALINAIPDGAHLVVVGDPAQLPSIGPGRVLGDLIDADAIPITELRRCTGSPRAAASPGWPPQSAAARCRRSTTRPARSWWCRPRDPSRPPSGLSSWSPIPSRGCSGCPAIRCRSSRRCTGGRRVPRGSTGC